MLNMSLNSKRKSSKKTRCEDGDFIDVVEDLTFVERNHELNDRKGTESTDKFSRSSLDEERADQDKNTPQDKQQLYPGAKVTIGAVMVLLSLFTIGYNITGEAIIHLLKLISLMLPCGHALPNTLLKFKKFFNKLQRPFTLHYYCPLCLTHVDSKNAKTCPNRACSLLKRSLMPRGESLFCRNACDRSDKDLFLEERFLRRHPTSIHTEKEKSK